jgi:hypothetical protein
VERETLLGKCRSALVNHKGSPYGGWSPREQLAVALVLGDQGTLDEWETTALDAIQTVRDGMADPPPDMATWLREIRDQLDTEGVTTGG